MATCTYKLTYFNDMGRGEIIRFIFAQAGVKYEDNRIAREQWQELKPSTPFGALPVIEEDGKQLSGCIVCAKYLAEKFGLAGANEFENAEIASIVDVMEDVMKEMAKLFYEKDEDRKKELAEKMKEFLPTKFALFEKRAAGNENGWLFGNKLTWADLLFYLLSGWAIMGGNKDIVEKFAGLQKLHASVEALPNIAKWIKERPQTNR